MFAVLAAGLLLVVVAPPASAAAGDLDPAFNRSGMVHDRLLRLRGRPGLRGRGPGRRQGRRGGTVAGHDAGLRLRAGQVHGERRAGRQFDDGRVLTGFGRGTATFNDQAYGLAIQADGKIVAAGWAGPYLAVARYTTAGKLDTSFSGDGKQLITFGFTGTGLNVANAVAIQADGKIVVAGEAWNGVDFDVALARFNTNGSLDSTFGGGGKVLTDYGTDDHGRGLDIAAVDGQISVAGVVGTSTDYDIAVARYDTDGGLDQSFSGDGKKIVVYAGMNGLANGVAVDPNNGRIVVAGTVSSPGVFDFALVRLKPGGQLIGKGQTDFGGAQDLGQAVAIQPNGRIVVAGLGNDDNFGLARYTPNGVARPALWRRGEGDHRLRVGRRPAPRRWRSSPRTARSWRPASASAMCPAATSRGAVSRHLRSAGQVQDGVRVLRRLVEDLDGVCRRNHDEVDLATTRFLHDLGEDRKRAGGAGADHQPAALPRDVLRGRQRRVAVLGAQRLGRSLLPRAHLTAVDDDVAVVRRVVDADGTERVVRETHAAAPSGDRTAIARGRAK